MAHLGPIAGAFLLLAAAACGEDRSDPAAGKSEEQLRREIEAVAVPKPLPKDLPPPFRLRPLSAAEADQFVRGRPACTLTARDRIFFVTTGREGVANVDGQLRTLAATGPVGPTGGFFSAEGATISIGRVAQYAGRAEAYVPGWRVAVAVGGATAIKPQEFDGSWTCRNAAAPEAPAPQ